jgi:lysophospholipase L1-like esterase
MGPLKNHSMRLSGKTITQNELWKYCLFLFFSLASSRPGSAGALQVGEVKPLPATQPLPRTDANSHLAHLQLLEKAKKGGIDIYFLGDSITRRWGCSDAAYATFLANWKANFFGWNAADFGWGADQIQNILWRIENGELDGVNPKIIVILAGTNNVGADTSAADVTQGLKALVDMCRQKAPAATIVLSGIFPRSDKPDLNPIISEINKGLEKFADNKSIRFLNVNDKLTDSSGKLLDGMTVDGLHPTLKGYQIWADGLKPIFTEILGSPALTDHAPPPTGDPSASH